MKLSAGGTLGGHLVGEPWPASGPGHAGHAGHAEHAEQATQTSFLIINVPYK